MQPVAGRTDARPTTSGANRRPTSTLATAIEPSATILLPTATATPHPLAAELDPPRHGVIVARFDGLQQTWHTGLVQQEGEPLNLSFWQPGSDGADPPLTTLTIFAFSPPAFAASAAGEPEPPASTVIEITVRSLPLQVGNTFELTVPASADSPRVVISYIAPYQGRTVAYILSSGVLQLTLARANAGEPALVAGTFAGTLADTRDSEPRAPDIQITDGEFYVEAIRYNPVQE